MGKRFELEAEIEAYYGRGDEGDRLFRSGSGRLEYLRTRELLERFLPRPPAEILDVGGGSGVYAMPLAREGYSIHLIDPMLLHVEEAKAASDGQPDAPLASAEVGDARSLDHEDDSADAVMLLGPLYHLPSRSERMLALREARRVLRPGGVVAGAAISRFASMHDGLHRGFIDNPEFEAIVDLDLAEGRHRNPSGRPGWFTTAYFHMPDELRGEVAEAGFEVEAVVGVEGPASFLPDVEARLDDETRREKLMSLLRRVEAEPSILGSGSHLLIVGRKPRF